MEQNNNCLCGSLVEYKSCCGVFHNSNKHVLTAEALMRSRFTAYAYKHSRYLLNTWDISTRPKHINFSNDNNQWLRLEILRTKKGMLKDEKGLVEFKAYFFEDNALCVLHEVSCFIKQLGQWYYLEGKIKFIGPI